MVGACAVDPIQLPDFEAAERSVEEEVTDPVSYPILCAMPWATVQCWKSFEVFEEIAENNKDMAAVNASIARDSDAAYDRILSAAKQQQAIVQIREDMLAAERRDHFIDNTERGLVILILGLGLIL